MKISAQNSRSACVSSKTKASLRDIYVKYRVVDPANKPATTNITEKSQYGGHCDSLHSTTF